jgi:cystathionine beta-lyase/cystathionine gamma-synthase
MTDPSGPTPATAPPDAVAPAAERRAPSLDTIAVRGGRRENSGALATPLWATSVFEQGSLEELRKLGTRSRPAKFYSRYANPTVTAFEEAVAELEGAESSLAFASGMGAIFATVLGLCSKGSHIVAQHQMYGGTLQLLRGVCPRLGIDVTFVDATRPGAFAAAVEPGRTMLVLAETPANPCLDLVDLEELAALQGPITAVDATFATPLGLRPLDYGISLSIHSATKAMAGHNDATLGVISGERDLIDWLWGFATLQGATPSPFDALNGLRGLRTLGVRVRQQSATALALAEALEARGDVSNVRYPGLASHPQHGLAQRQLQVMGGLLSFDLADFGAACAFVDSLRLCRLGPSLGGPETLITHPASTSHAGLGPEELAEAGVSEGTVRVSAGLEATEDVLADVLGGVDAAGRLEVPPKP